MPASPPSDPLDAFAPPVSGWFRQAFPEPTAAQMLGWPPISGGRSTLLLAPTGSGKTLAAFLTALDRIMFRVAPDAPATTRVVYVSPLKALGVDVERNLRAPLAGIRAVAQKQGLEYRMPRVGIRTGDTPQRERRQLIANPPDILITTPESLYLMLTSRARETLRSVETVILDEIHAVAGTKRGSHLMLSLERLEGERRLGAWHAARQAEEARPRRDSAKTAAAAARKGAAKKKSAAKKPAPPSRRRRDDDDEPLSPASTEAFSVDLLPVQRIGLSATQRPLEEIARLLGGYDVPAPPAGAPHERASPVPRPVEIVDARVPKRYEVTVEVPVEDMARLGEIVDEMPSGPVSGGPPRRSIWPSIHPRLVELIRAHRSTLIFVNSRRLAERLAGAINELAEEEIALAHHGSMSPGTRADIEDRLKRGKLPALVATATLELGIDMGAIDLVVQIEAPPSVAAGIQRFGRSGHGVGETSKGVIFPKFRLDLVACAAVAEHIRSGHVESTRYPRNPLDVLAQQIVATVATGRADVDVLDRLVRGAAPFAELDRSSLEGVLDLLAGRYPSDAFRELRPRLNWDRVAGTLEPRRGARSMAVISGGTIPDRGLYGVFLAGSEPPVRVGELDEEMVFESREGEIFLLGASSWRIEEIAVDRVLVSPAPGEPGKMPFWRGEGPGRPVDFGRAIGAMTRELAAAEPEEATTRLSEAHGLDERAARNLVELLAEQKEAAGAVPDDRTIILERFVDEMGDDRVAVLSPFGSPVHAPWAMAVGATLRREHGLDPDLVWGDDGIIFRFTAMDDPPPDELFVPDPDEVTEMVIEELSGTALFAARFRENAARALLLPRSRPGKRTPLWLQRRRSADLLEIAADHPDFPIVLETYRECLKDVFDMDGLVELLQGIRGRTVRLVPVTTDRPSPWSSSLLFGYAANFLYEGDAPLAERRAHALTLDHAQLARLLGEPELRELLDPDAVEEVARQVARLDGRLPLRDADDLHDLLLALGDLAEEEIAARAGAGVSGASEVVESAEGANVVAGAQAPDGAEDGAPPLSPSPADGSGPAALLPGWLTSLRDARRAALVRIGTEERWIAAEDAARYRDALGVVPPGGMPFAFLEAVDRPLEDLIGRWARTHGPFTSEEVAARLDLGVAPVLTVLEKLADRGRVVRGHFLPSGTGHEWVDADVLRRIKSKSLARLRAEVEPVEQAALARFALGWHGVDHPARGHGALVEVIQQLQGAPVPASDLERSILPLRLQEYDPRDLDALGWSGQVIWAGVRSTGHGDGRIALYLREHYDLLAPTPGAVEGDIHERIREAMGQRGALFFADILQAVEGFPPEVESALHEMVWAGEVTNDTLAPLRSLRRNGRTRRSRSGRGSWREDRSGTGSRVGAGVRRGAGRRSVRPGTEGRWSLLPSPGEGISDTERAAALATQFLERHGVLTREAVRSEGPRGGFGSVYGILKGLEGAGRVRRGYFVEGLGAVQFALPGAEERLRARRDRGRDRHGSDPEVVLVPATDPANPWGAALPWPDRDGARPRRSTGAWVVLEDGALLGWVSRTGNRVLAFVREEGAAATKRLQRLAEALTELPERIGRRAIVVRQVDGDSPGDSLLGPALREAGFRPGYKGWQWVMPRDGGTERFGRDGRRGRAGEGRTDLDDDDSRDDDHRRDDAAPLRRRRGRRPRNLDPDG